jgi:hypothetical protein
VSTRSLNFELHVFAEPETMADLLKDVPSVRHALFVVGVPKGFIGRRYAVDSNVTLLAREGSAPLVRFGSSGLADAMCVDIMTEHVIEIINAPASEPLFVNTSIEQFTRTVKAVVDRFPYYVQEASDDEIILVAGELLDIIRSIDPEAAVPNRYWSTFVDDVQIGDLSTEAILAIGE